ncbi:MAG TPA: hypothetical protein VK427_05615, partial [Kofleriaceae bacterium]|nr:hypothetical protein [Kofleriaceae bacterium]
MRWPWVFSIAMIPAVAHTRPMRDTSFWREIVDPHADEVNAIAASARELMNRPDHTMAGDTEWAVEQRAKFYRDARAMLAYARKLSPNHVEILALAGRAAAIPASMLGGFSSD